MDRNCPACAVVSREHRFCSQCGGALNGRPRRRSPAAASPSQYTPRQLAERILASRDSMEGERKIVTVLFADIKDLTLIIEGLDPEEASKRLRPVPAGHARWRPHV